MKDNYSNCTTKIYGLHIYILLCLSLVTTLLHAQTSYTITHAGAIGRFGPNQTQVTNAYNGTSLQGMVTVSGGIQTLTLQPGNYRIEAYGAQGGYSDTYIGGSGATIRGDFSLTTTSTVNVLAGQSGENVGIGYNTGGGGGSFVWLAGASLPLVAAGGGGGAGSSNNGVNGATTTAGTAGTGIKGIPGANGNGAKPGGGGWLSTGSNFVGSSNCYAKCTGNVNGLLVGGASPTTTILYHGCGGTFYTGDGGFGGGSGGTGECGSYYGAGGGGGYSGGVGQSDDYAGGGGGGSYNGGSNQLNAAGTNTGNGKVIITDICPLVVSGVTSNSLQPAVCLGNSVTLTTSGIGNYSWSTGAQSSSITVSPTITTTYSVIATTSLNCSVLKYITVVVNTGAPVLTITSNTTSVCLGNTVSLSASGAVSYSWTNGISNGQTFTPTVTQTYSVTGANGCGSTSSVQTITVTPISVNVTASPSIICQGYPSTLTAIAAATGYSWFPAAPSASLIVINPLSSVVYTAVVSNGICKGSSTVALTANATPTVTASGSASALCDGASAILTASGASSYVWTPGNISGATITVTPNTSISYQVAGSNSTGCAGLANVVIAVIPTPTVNAVANKTLVCENGTATLVATGASSYSWNGVPTSQIYVVNPSVTSQFTVTGMSQNGCTNQAVVNINVYIPVLNVAATPTAVCYGGTVKVTANVQNGSGYTWNGLPGPVFQFSPTSSTIYIASANSSSSSVTCPAIASLAVVVNTNPTVSATADKIELCQEEKAPVITADGALTYLWQNNGAISNTISAANYLSDSYTVTGTDKNGCTGTATIAITVHACTGVAKFAANSSLIRVYPNPSRGSFSVTATGRVTLKLINSLGQGLRTINLSGNSGEVVLLENFPEGIYFVVSENVSPTIIEKIIITH